MTDSPEKPGRLDLYVEKIVSYMNLDDAQRDDVVRELRSHLEEAIDEATRRGMPRDRAETVAMERFGDPAMLAGQFGTLQGRMWIIFEAVAYAAVLAATYQMALRFNPQLQPQGVSGNHILIAAVAMACIVVIARLWNRVQVNGSLRIYRFMQRTKVIPFDAISDVRLDRFHLVGPRKIHIKYADNKKAAFSSGYPNARSVGIALEVLAPASIQPRAAEYFRKLRLKTGTESVAIKLAFSVGWAAVAGALAWSFPLLWKSEGISVAYAIAIYGVLMLLWLQYHAHSDRAKKSLAMGLAFLMIFFVIPWSITPLVGPIDTRPLILLIALILPLPLVLLWWHTGRRIVMTVAAVAWIAAAYATIQFVPINSSLRPRSVGIVSGYTGNGTWITGEGSGSPVFASIGMFVQPRQKDSKSIPMLTLTSDRQTTMQLLDEGSWSVIAGGQKSPAALLSRDIGKDRDELKVSEIYRLSADGSLEKLGEVNDAYLSASSFVSPAVSLSPGGRYFVTKVKDAADMTTKDTHLNFALFDVQARQLKVQPDVTTATALRWTTSATLELAVSDSTDTGIETGKYHVWQLDADTGDYHPTGRKYNFGSGVSLTHKRSDSHAILEGKEVFALADLDKGTSVGLPLPVGRYPEIDWNVERDMVCYIANGSGSRNLVLAGPEGVVKKLPLSDTYEISLLQISPDGNKVFYLSKKTGGYFFPIGQLQVWDVKRNVVKKVGVISMIGTALAFVSQGVADFYSAVQWTPDSQSVLWSSYEFVWGSKNAFATDFRYLDYEAWAQSGFKD